MFSPNFYSSPLQGSRSQSCNFMIALGYFPRISRFLRWLHSDYILSIIFTIELCSLSIYRGGHNRDN
jgi:hypothetical protein